MIRMEKIQWEQFTDDEEEAEDVQADLYGNVFVTGRSFANGNYSYLALKYSSYQHIWHFATDSIGDTTHLAGEVVVHFDPNYLLMDKINTPNITFGQVKHFVQDSIIQKMDDETGLVLEDAIMLKVFPNLIPNDSISISRLGDTIPVPKFWSWFVLVLAETQTEALVDEVEIADSLRKVVPGIFSTEVDFLYKSTIGTNDPEYNNGNQSSLLYNGISSSITGTNINGHINIESAWDYTVGSENIIVGVYDSGINWGHEDFGDGTFAGSKISGGYDYENDQAIDRLRLSKRDRNNHGTKTAGIIGAYRNNNLGISGIAGGNIALGNTGCQLQNMKILRDHTGYARGSAVSDAIIEGARHTASTGRAYGQHIMNHSYGSGFNNDPSNSDPNDIATARLLIGAFQFAFNNQVIMVTSRGNGRNGVGTNDPDWPGSFRDELSINVGASGLTGLKTARSDFGDKIDVVAPGITDMITSTSGKNNSVYGSFNGSSASVPHVSAVAALILSYVEENITDIPNKYSPEDVEFILQSTAVQRRQPNSQGWQLFEGFGLLQAGAALAAIDKDDYKILHLPSSQTSVTRTETIIGTDIYAKLTSPDGYSGIVKCDIYKIELSFDHAQDLNPGDLVLDKWGRNSSSICWGEPIPVSGNPNYTYEIQNAFPDFQWTFSQNTSTAIAIGYTYYVKEVKAVGVTIPWNDWEPINKNDIEAAYSIYIEKNTTTDLKDKQESSFKIFPNPTNSFIIIKSNQNHPTPLFAELLSIDGKTIANYQGPDSLTKWEIPLPASLPQGIYMLKVFVKGGVPFFEKILKR